MSNLSLMGAGPESGGAAFSPSSITGLQAWYKADAGTSTTTDGVAISQWDDQSGNTRHATQATGAQQPLYKAAIQNGLPGVKFDGTDDSLVQAAVNVSQPDTIFMVSKMLGTTQVYTPFDGATARQTCFRATAVSDLIHVFAGNDIGTTASWDVTNAHLHSFIFNGASSAFWYDTVSVTIGSTPGANALTSLVLGKNGPATTFWDGYIFEWLIYSSALNGTDRGNVETYLKAKWGTP